MLNTILTLPRLTTMQPGEVFAKGEIENSPQGIYMVDSNVGKMLCWVAKRGRINDWAIYITWAEYGYGYCLTNGDKVTNDANIKKLVPCDDAALKMYRK